MFKRIRWLFLDPYYAVRYGKWSCGWEWYEGKPRFGLFAVWYDCQHVAFHCYKFYVCVSY